jgi:hypothetical protein
MEKPKKFQEYRNAVCSKFDPGPFLDKGFTKRPLCQPKSKPLTSNSKFGLAWSLAWLGVWLGLEFGLAWSLAWLGVWLGLEFGLAWSLAWLGVWLGLEFGLAWSLVELNYRPIASNGGSSKQDALFVSYSKQKCLARAHGWATPIRGNGPII